MKRFHDLTGLLLIGLMLSAGGCGDPGTSVSVPATPDGAVKAVVDGLQAHRPQVVWAALPASYQQDVTFLIHESAQKMDKDVYDKGFQVAGKIVNVLRTKQQFILDHPLLAMAISDRAEAEKGWPAFVGMLDTLVRSELADLDKVRNLDVNRFLGGTGAKLMQHMADVSALTPDDPWSKIRNVTVELVETAGDSATVRVSDGTDSDTIELTRVENRWVPAEMAADWPNMMAEARQNLAESSADDIQQMKPMILGTLAMVESVADQLAAAQTQEQFNQVIEGVMGMMMGGGMGGPQPGW